MPAAMSAAPASATLLARGNRREWLMMNSRVIRSSRVGAILLRFAGQSNSLIGLLTSGGRGQSGSHARISPG
ncbi:hypothetical protein FRA07_02390 [Klebsiella quasipneumoniae subsp. similipneumoniae]|nr:hypothetical protein CUC76_02630 [Enterobacteriaceae bacterium S05]PLD65275.1 hypothetical protein B6I57_08180 [Klebsiella quasipneumoniae]RWT62133.1 hypothetical protein DN601_10795 [Klebsiella quasipneumoniae subsp. similipneumoniae]PLF09364.1 hypothetical protein B6I82_04160 [Klebsiella quasipneumoniae]PLJ28727.1 hypothetical protein B6J62_25035 [Klebsiella quasipneumoniae]